MEPIVKLPGNFYSKTTSKDVLLSVLINILINNLFRVLFNLQELELVLELELEHICFVSYLKDELEKIDPDLLKLGLLYEVGVDAATVQEPETLLSFQHKSLHEYASSKHLAKRLDNIMEEGRELKVNTSLFCNNTN